MKKAIEQKSLSIVCDNTACDFEQVINFNERLDWLNKPCAKCGDNLLNEGDLKAMENMRAVADFINGLVGGVDPKEKHTPISFHYHDGKLKTEILGE